jgi:hypothetical protein
LPRRVSRGISGGSWAKLGGAGIVELIMRTDTISENFRANPNIDHKNDRKNRGVKGGF